MYRSAIAKSLVNLVIIHEPVRWVVTHGYVYYPVSWVENSLQGTEIETSAMVVVSLKARQKS
jgi:hypothetical protein